MKKAKSVFALMMAAALFATLLAGCGSGGKMTVTVYNELGYDIAELYISESSSDTWGDPVIASGLETGSSAKVVLDTEAEPVFDVYALDTDGDNYVFYGLTLANKAELTLESTEDAWQAAVSSGRGEPVVITGEFTFGDVSEGKVSQPPTKDDPLDMSIALPQFESVVIPYPSTLKVIGSEERRVEFDAVADDESVYETIIFSMFPLGGSYEGRLNSGGETAKAALSEVSAKIRDMMFPELFLEGIGFDFVDGGSYFAGISYMWMKGEVFENGPTTPVRGVLECRFYGDGNVLTAFTLANESEIQRYYEISSGILNAISYNEGWSTANAAAPSSGEQWSDPGDNGYYYDDYDPWSDPGDYGYYYDDEEWYEPNDAGWSDPGDYYYEDGTWYESNDADW